MKFVGILPGITRTITTSKINNSKNGKRSNNEDKQTNTKHHQTPSTKHQQHTTNNTQQATHKKQQHATSSNTQQATPNKQQPPNHTVTRVVAVHHDNDNGNVIGKKKTLAKVLEKGKDLSHCNKKSLLRSRRSTKATALRH